MNLLTDAQAKVMNAVLDEESARREHLVVYLSGAHAYGFPSPDSDLDLKCIHIATTASLVGLEPPRATFDRAEVIEGVEIDYTSNELVHVLQGVLHGNGNFLERILGRTCVRASPLLDELRPLVIQTLSRRVHRHYKGFARSQLEFLNKDPTVKKLLYVLRTALTGTHLLRTGELEADLTRLLDAYDLRDAASLVEAKRAGERTAAEPALLDAWRPRLSAVLERLDDAWPSSVLPIEPRGIEELQAWLVEVRRTRWP